MKMRRLFLLAATIASGTVFAAENPLIYGPPPNFVGSKVSVEQSGSDYILRIPATSQDASTTGVLQLEGVKNYQSGFAALLGADSASVVPALQAFTTIQGFIDNITGIQAIGPYGGTLTITGNQTVSGDVTFQGLSTPGGTPPWIVGTADSAGSPNGDLNYYAFPAIPTGANPTAEVDGTVVNGVAATFMRSDAAPPLADPLTPADGDQNITGDLTTSGDLAGANLSGTNTGDLTIDSSLFLSGLMNLNGGPPQQLYLEAPTGPNLVFATQATGVALYPTFRSLVAADLPAGTTPVGANPTASVDGTVVNGVAATFMRSDAAPPLADPLTPADGTQNIAGALRTSTTITADGNATVSGGTTTLGGTQPTITTATSAFISAEPGAAGSIAVFDYQNVDGNTGGGALAGSGFAFSGWYKGKRSGGAAPTNSERILMTMQPGINGGAFTMRELVAGTGTARGIFIEAAGSADINLGTGSTQDTNVSGAAVIQGNLSFNGNGTFGNASGDTITTNAGSETIANDYAVALSGGVNGINFDSNTLSIDASNDRVGFKTAAPSSTVHVVGDIRGEATRWRDTAASNFPNTSWTLDSGGTFVLTASDAALVYIPINYEAGTTVSRIRVKWQGVNASDGVKFRIVKRDESGTATAWTVEGAQQSPATSASVTVTTYDIADFAMSTNTSYSIEVESEVVADSARLYAVGVETTFRIY